MTREIIQHTNIIKMKILNFLAIALIVAAFASCDKDSAVSVVDNTPDFEVVEETSNTGHITLGLTTIECNEVALATFYVDGETTVNNYSLNLSDDAVGTTGFLFAGAWAPTEAESALREGAYNDPDGTISSFTEEGAQIIQDWIDAGSDPDNQPALEEEHFIIYAAAGVTYTISNITETTADVEVSGEMTDQDGNAVGVEGSFVATLY